MKPEPEIREQLRLLTQEVDHLEEYARFKILNVGRDADFEQVLKRQIDALEARVRLLEWVLE